MHERERALALCVEELALARRVGLASAMGIATKAMALVEGGVRGMELLVDAVDLLGSPHGGSNTHGHWPISGSPSAGPARRSRLVRT